jgi:hypothetical protein
VTFAARAHRGRLPQCLHGRQREVLVCQEAHQTGRGYALYSWRRWLAYAQAGQDVLVGQAGLVRHDVGFRLSGRKQVQDELDCQPGAADHGLPASTWGSTTMRSGQPLTVFDIKGVPGNRRQRIEAAVVGGGKQARGPHDAWIAADPFKGGFRVLITGPQRFERTVVFAASSKKVRRSCYVPSVRRPRSNRPNWPLFSSTAGGPFGAIRYRTKVESPSW